MTENKQKVVLVDEDVHTELNVVKAADKAKSLNEVIRHLLKKSR